MGFKFSGNRPLGRDPFPFDAGSYRGSLISVTRIGGITATICLSFFVIIYWIIGLPPVVVWINGIALLINLVGLGLVSFGNVHKPAAHLILLATYISLFGTALFTGGIDASSMVWLLFLPVPATMMAGTTDGVLWGMFSIMSIIGMYVLNRIVGIDFTLVPTMSQDRMLDLAMVTTVTTTTILLNERIKARALRHLENAQAMLNRLAHVDPLTDVFNRRYFFDQAQIELELARLRGSHTSLLLLDIDHFKEINDTYGHTIGDQILVALVGVCQKGLREIDTLARLGGEEFVILLPETTLSEAYHVADRLRLAVENAWMETDGGLLCITVSIGVMSQTTSDAALPLHKLLHRADQAMYQAKRAGRNRVMIWQSQDSTRTSQ